MTDLRRRLSSLVALSGLATLAGFGTQLLVAYHFGTSDRLDAYWLALAVATTLSFYVHPLRESMIGVVFRAAKSHPDRASEVLSAGALLLLVISCLAALVLGVGAHLSWFPSGSVDQVSFSHLLLAFLPFMFLFALSETFNAVLLSLDLAQQQAWARLLSSSAAVLCIGLLGGWLGIYAMVISLLVGQLVVLVWSWKALSARGLGWRPVGFAPLKDRIFVSMFLSLLLNYILAQSYMFAERWTMSDLQAGSLSAYQYATMLVNVMISLLALPMFNLLWPRLLELEHSENRKQMPSIVWNSSAPVVFLLLALSAFTWHAAPQIVSLLFERGSFGASSLQQTVSALRLTVFASVPISLVTVALRALMSQGQSRQVVGVGIFMAIIGLAVLGSAWLMRSLVTAQSHWFIANACGALLAWIWLVREAEDSLTFSLSLLYSALLSVVAVGLPLLLIPSIDFGRLTWQLTISLLLQALMYGVLVLIIALFLRLVDGARLLQRLRMR